MSVWHFLLIGTVSNIVGGIIAWYVVDWVFRQPWFNRAFDRAFDYCYDRGWL